MKLNESGRQKLEKQISWGKVKHTGLHSSGLLQALALRDVVGQRRPKRKRRRPPAQKKKIKITYVDKQTERKMIFFLFPSGPAEEIKGSVIVLKGA